MSSSEKPAAKINPADEGDDKGGDDGREPTVTPQEERGGARDVKGHNFGGKKSKGEEEAELLTRRLRSSTRAIKAAEQEQAELGVACAEAAKAFGTAAQLEGATPQQVRAEMDERVQ